MSNGKRACAAVALAILAAAASGGETPPAVRVQVVVVSPTIRTALGAGTADLERAVAEFIVAAGKLRFKFLPWSAGAGDASTPRLVAQLVDRPPLPGSEPLCGPPELQLVVGGSLDGAEVWSVLPEKVLGRCRLLNAAQADDLVAPVTAAFQRVLEDFGNAEALQRAFLGRVPLTRALETENRKVFLPLNATSLAAGEESELQVLLGPSRTDGEIVLHPWAGIDDRTQVGFASFRCGDINVAADNPSGQEWDDRLAQVLERCKPPVVFMRKYVPGDPPTVRTNGGGLPPGGVVSGLSGGQP